MDIFKQGATWQTQREKELVASRKLAWRVASVFGFCFVVAAISLAVSGPLRRTVPYIVKIDTQTGNSEVLQAFDNRLIGNQELLNKHWAERYVQAREQYNWWLIGADYDVVAAMTAPTIFSEYGDQFKGDKSLDKIFADHTDRKIKILSVTPSPTNPMQMVVRIERTTISKGMVVEQPTTFAVNMTYRYNPNTYASETDLRRNPMGFEVYSYRRDAEVRGAAPVVQAPNQGS